MNNYFVKIIKNGEFAENGYLVQSIKKNVIIIDPGGNKDYFIQLIKDEKRINPSIKASSKIEEDIITLLNFSQYYHNLKVNSHWGKALPIYPTSPIDKKN